MVWFSRVCVLERRWRFWLACVVGPPAYTDYVRRMRYVVGPPAYSVYASRMRAGRFAREMCGRATAGEIEATGRRPSRTLRIRRGSGLGMQNR